MNAWNNFNGGNWENEINVRDFIQKNYTPYDGDGAFLAPATARTTALREKFDALLAEEREKGGVRNIDTETALQRLAKSGVCVIALSQLSRGGEGMAALRGSGQIEQDADVVMLLDYPSEKDVESDEEAADLEAGRLRVIEIVKNKGGRRGSIPFWFCGSQQRFLAQWQGFYQSKLRMMEDDATA